MEETLNRYMCSVYTDSHDVGESDRRGLPAVALRESC